MILPCVILCCLLGTGISIGENLILSPFDTVAVFLDQHIIFSCSHTHERESIESYLWLINDTILTPQLRLEYEVDVFFFETRDYSALYIYNIPEKFNNTEVKCAAFLSGQVVPSSRKAKLLLQGYLSAVSDLEITVDNDYVSLSWSPPFSFAVFDNTRISYQVKVENVTSSEITVTNTDLSLIFLRFPSASPLGCDNLKFHVMPTNPVGMGEVTTISHINRIPLQSHYQLILNSRQQYDVILLLSTQLCSISNLHLINLNLNEELIVEEFNSFTSLNTRGDYYRYRLNLNLRRRFEYILEMTFENFSGSKPLNFSISTHTLSAVDVEVTPHNQLQIQVHYFPHNTDSVGTFLTLLYCKTIFCNDIDFEESLYLFVHGTESYTYDLTFASGNYLLYAYDTDADGSVLPSINGTSFPISGHQLFLFHPQELSNVPTRNQFCNLNYSREAVISICNNENISGKQQILLQPIYSSNRFAVRLLISDLVPLNEATCIQLIDDLDYYGVTILVNNLSTLRSPEAIGRSAISKENAIDFSEVLCYDTNEILTTVQKSIMDQSDTSQIIVLVITAVSFILVSIIVIAVFSIIKVLRKRYFNITIPHQKECHTVPTTPVDQKSDLCDNLQVQYNTEPAGKHRIPDDQTNFP